MFFNPTPQPPLLLFGSRIATCDESVMTSVRFMLYSSTSIVCIGFIINFSFCANVMDFDERVV